MNALWRGALPADDAMQLLPMTVAQLDAVMAIEVAAYPFPWTRGNFIDSLAAGYSSWVLAAPRGEMLGYFVAMAGFEEMHLLNITVAESARGRGLARAMLEALLAECRQAKARELWLEVRMSNAHARAVYAHLGFAEVAQRKNYYPAGHGRREDAIVMSRAVVAPAGQSDDALD